jgi:hypothetical protein
VQLAKTMSLDRVLLASLLFSAAAPAQIQMQGSGPGAMVRIYNTDAAILESGETRKDLPCEAEPIKAMLGFDLRFHSGYEVTVPLRELAGAEDLLTIIFRVSDVSRPDEPVYFSQKIRVPPIEEDAKGDAYLQGVFDLGEGNYKVDWLMRDRSDRVCSANWDLEVSLPARDKGLQLEIAPGTVQTADRELYRDEPPVERQADNAPLNVKVMVNFAPQNARAATLQPLDTRALLSILRSIAREPRIGRFSVVAFNMQEQKVIYRQEGSQQIDFPALGEAVEGLNLGTVDLKRLSQKHGDTAFLTTLISKEITPEPPVDAVIFAGPKVMLEENVPAENLAQIGDPEFPVFYMNYNLNPQSNPWRDAIGNAVKFFKGTEYTITRPRDLWFAWSEIISRIVKLKSGRRSSSASSQ